MWLLPGVWSGEITDSPIRVRLGVAQTSGSFHVIRVGARTARDAVWVQATVNWPIQDGRFRGVATLEDGASVTIDGQFAEGSDIAGTWDGRPYEARPVGAVPGPSHLWYTDPEW